MFYIIKTRITPYFSKRISTCFGLGDSTSINTHFNTNGEYFPFFVSRNEILRNQVYDYLKNTEEISDVLDSIGPVLTFKKKNTQIVSGLNLDYLDFIATPEEMLEGNKTKYQLIEVHNCDFNPNQLKILRKTFGPEII